MRPAAAIAVRLGIPWPPLLFRTALEAATLWCLLRTGLVAALWLIIGPIEAARTPTLFLPALLVWIERRRNREILLQAELAASEWWFALVGLSVGLLLDVIAILALEPT